MVGFFFFLMGFCFGFFDLLLCFFGFLWGFFYLFLLLLFCFLFRFVPKSLGFIYNYMKHTYIDENIGEGNEGY